MNSYEKNILAFSNQLEGRGLSGHGIEALRGFVPDGIVVCGMGGSGTIGTFLEHMARSIGIRIPILTVKDIALPKVPFAHPLFICISFSGNTKETIGVARAALKVRGAKVALVTTGGALLRLALAKKLPHVTFDPGGLTPRGASGYMYYATLEIIKKVLPMRVPKISKLISPSRIRTQGKELARKFAGTNVLVYSSFRNAHIGYIWKTNLNETGKVPAFANTYPEIYHNEIVGFEKTRVGWSALWLIERHIAPHEARRLKSVRELLTSRGIRHIVVPLKGKNPLEELWYAVILSHWASMYLAEMRHIDPTATRAIDTLKNKSSSEGGSASGGKKE